MDPTNTDELSYYKKEVENLKAQHEKDESNFGQKRAQFMELYSKKEEEIKQITSQLQTAEANHLEVTDELSRLKVELNDINTATMISETGREDEVYTLQRKYTEEVASLQLLMKESIATAEDKLRSESDRYSHVIRTLEQELDETKQKLEETKQKLNQDVEGGGMISSVVKTLTKKVTVPLSGMTREEEDENLEESMKKAQEDSNLLKSVVLPLEAEIACLREQLASTERTLQKYEPDFRLDLKCSTQISDQSQLESHQDLQEKISELRKNLESEKSSRSDLEMYVAVLSAQIDKLRQDLHESFEDLEQEKRDHMTLKGTWSVANDEFLQSQRLLMMDMNRMESLFTPQQIKTLEELKQADAQREAQEQKVRELEDTRLEEEEEKRRGMDSPDQSESVETSPSKIPGSLNSLLADDILKYDSGDEGSMRASLSNHSFNKDKEFGDVGAGGVKSPDGGATGITGSSDHQSPEQRPLVRLSQAQQKCISDTQFEVRLPDNVLAGVKAKSEQLNLAGKRFVSDNEWSMLQRELVAARERLGKPCDMCTNYESQLQQVQDNEKKALAQARNLDRQLENERSTVKGMQEYTSQLETSLKDTTLESQNKISDLTEEVHKQEDGFTMLRQSYSALQDELCSELRTLMLGREDLQHELEKLEAENDNLVAKHSKHSQQLQEETINLPENLEDMQLLLLKYREDIISAKVAKEYVEETLKSEILFLKSQMVAEQQEKATIEESLTNEISQLQHQNMLLQSVQSELQRQTKVREDCEQRLVTLQQTTDTSREKHNQLISALQIQVKELSAMRTRLENTVHEQKVKIHALQVDLENSEAVQRDFVKLSQSLQIQLEKIRSSENEVRWEHDEDTEECQNCKKSFHGNNRKKNHCRHCGKIYCADCLTKTVRSGPKMRPSRVCDVCHTILVQDATPYFSVEPPQTPD